MRTSEQRIKDWWTAMAMKRYGGSFVRHLGEMYFRADENNVARIKEAWPEYWEKYTKLGERHKKEGDDE